MSRKLLIQAFLGLGFLLLVLALALFIPAGSLSYWQAWVYLGVFGLSTLLITLDLMRYDPALLERRVRGGPTAETQKSQQIIQGFASFFFVLLYIVAGLDFRFGWSHVPPVVSIIADTVVALGFYIVYRVFKENTYTSATIEVADEQKVISTGPYGVVRHPMYSGAFLLLLFTPLALGSYVALPFPIPLIAVIVVRLLAEEKYLAANLPGYEAYRQKVRYRLLPYFW